MPIINESPAEKARYRRKLEENKNKENTGKCKGYERKIKGKGKGTCKGKWKDNGRKKIGWWREMKGKIREVKGKQKEHEREIQEKCKESDIILES